MCLGAVFLHERSELWIQVMGTAIVLFTVPNLIR